MERVAHHTDDFSERKFWSVAKALLETGNGVTFDPKGCSMSPFIREGQAVTISPCTASELKFGDVILHEGPRSTHRLHRVLKRRTVGGKEVLFTKGDGCFELDPPVEIGQVLGRVTSVKKGERVWYLDHPLGKVFNMAWSVFQWLPMIKGGRCFLR